MQLTARFALLVALVYAAPRVLALPIAGNSESIIARDVQYDIDARDLIEFDAREIDDLQFAARELLERYHQARDFFDDFDAREIDDLLFSRGPQTKALSQTIDAAVAAIIPLSDKLKTQSTVAPNIVQVLTWLDQEHKDKTFWKSQGPQSGSDDNDDDPKSIAFKKERAQNLEIVKNHATAPTTNVDGFKKAVVSLHTAMADRHKPFNEGGLSVAPELKTVLEAPTVNPQNLDLLSFALAKNEVLYLLSKISKATDNGYHDKALKEIAAKKAHNGALGRGGDTKAQLESTKWKALLASINKPGSSEGLAEVKKARDHVKRLRIILANNKSKPAYQQAVAAEDKYREKPQ